MAKVNVAQFATELKLPVEKLVEQLKSAGVKKALSEETALTEGDKTKLLEYLRKALSIMPDGEIASQFFALSVHPSDATSLLAATNEGLFASSDGGVNWEVRIPGAQTVGVTEVVRSASDPDLVYAAVVVCTRVGTHELHPPGFRVRFRASIRQACPWRG